MNLKEELKNLCMCSGVSGTENSVAEYAKSVMEKYGDCKIDLRGNFICHKQGKGKKILLDAHMDQIGFAVSEITENGFVKLSKVGGIDRRVILGEEVEILGEEKVYGVISCKPPHLTSDDEKDKASKIEDIAVDTGFTKSELEGKISVGDRVVFKPKYFELLNGRVSATAIDDRSGMAIIMRAMELLKDTDSDITAVFSVQEEVGNGGAGNASYSCDADEAIAVDVSFALQAETPSDQVRHCMPLGGGVFIGFAPILNHDMSKALVKIAKEKGIPYECEVVGGRTGTNADDITTAKYGKKTAMLSPPIRSMHTNTEIIDISDMEYTAQLIAEYVNRGEAE